jgi:hypothetical protein
MERRLAVTVTCALCGEPFTARRSDARFCSARCRVGAHRAGRSLPHQPSRSPDAWEEVVLSAAMAGWIYLAEVLADVGAASRAEYQAARLAMDRLAERGHLTVFVYQFGRPRLAIGPPGESRPVGRLRTRRQAEDDERWAARRREREPVDAPRVDPLERAERAWTGLVAAYREISTEPR